MKFKPGDVIWLKESLSIYQLCLITTNFDNMYEGTSYYSDHKSALSRGRIKQVNDEFELYSEIMVDE